MAQAAEAGGGRRCGAGTGAALVVALVVERVSPAAQVHRRGLYKPPRTDSYAAWLYGKLKAP